ncbi:Helix-turn-helix domain [Frankia torreyi]|uniref:Helix-turn-helix domain n=1 Tax=Frankia torreyi TaxID=1856 RepID=A0A0D8BHZ0_9ACTN|nr:MULTISPECIES: helix-turn-helix domain-containing protein [Frankia]KJE23695.1 Helix-turn-helix domain [Frankia torreyi]KQM05693.1 Helix-turn-helix domain [Frankia sp. CpI1-P]
MSTESSGRLGRAHLRPVADGEAEQVRALHAEGLSRNKIAERLGRSPSTVSKLAQTLGLEFDRAATRAATRAAVVDAAARRAEILTATYQRLGEVLSRLGARQPLAHGETKDGEIVESSVTVLPARDVQALATASDRLSSVISRLEAVDDGAASMSAVDEWLRAMSGRSA